MAEPQQAQLSPGVVLGEMKKNGVTHVVWLPDSETNWLYLLMKAEPSLCLVPVACEALAFSAAAGLSFGGKTPLILIQNTGLLESGNSYRGWTRHGVTQDSVAVYTERFLHAFGVHYYLVESDADAPRISVAFEEACKNRKPVAVLIGDEYHGFRRQENQA